MRWLKHILVLLVWLAASWPCMHAGADVHQEHDHADGVTLCAATAHGCECHACSEVPCTDKAIKLVPRVWVGDPVWQQPLSTPCFTASATRVVRIYVPPAVPGSLNWLRTVQLLL